MTGIMWTDNSKFQGVIDTADQHTHFIGNISVNMAMAIRAINPTAKLYRYLLYRYIQGPWYWGEWVKHCEKNRLNPDDGKLWKDGQEVMSTDSSKPWPVANMCNQDYRYWAANVFAKQQASHLDGVSVDHPYSFDSVEIDADDFDRDEYNEDCLNMFGTLNGVFGITNTLPNIGHLSTLNLPWAQTIVETTGAGYYQAGGDMAQLDKVPGTLAIVGGLIHDHSVIAGWEA